MKLGVELRDCAEDSLIVRIYDDWLCRTLLRNIRRGCLLIKAPRWRRLAQTGPRYKSRTSKTELSVRLVSYGYAAFTAGRYPGASGIVTGLTPPTFGS